MRNTILSFLGLLLIITLALYIGVDQTTPLIEGVAHSQFENTFKSDASQVVIMRVKDGNKVTHYLSVTSTVVSIETLSFSEGVHVLDLGDTKGYITVSYEEEGAKDYNLYYATHTDDFSFVNWKEVDIYASFFSTLLLFTGILIVVFALQALLKKTTSLPKEGPFKFKKMTRTDIAGVIVLGLLYLVLPYVVFLFFIFLGTLYLVYYIETVKRKIISASVYLVICASSIAFFLLLIVYFVGESNTEYVPLNVEVSAEFQKNYNQIIEDVAFYNEVALVYESTPDFSFLVIEAYAKFAYASDGQTIRPELQLMYDASSIEPVSIIIKASDTHVVSFQSQPNTLHSYLFDSIDVQEVSISIRRIGNNELIFESETFELKTTIEDVYALNKGTQFMENEGQYFLIFSGIAHGAMVFFALLVFLFRKILLKNISKNSGFYTFFIEGI